MNTRLVALAWLLLSVGPMVRPSAAQCPDGSAPPCRTTRAVVAPPPNSVAVLYFDNLSRDTSDAYLADGLTEELITRLGQSRLVVKPRNSVRRYRGVAASDPVAIGRMLGVAYLLSGSVRRGANRVRVTVELVRARTGTREWGDSYDITTTDPLEIQQQIATAVAVRIAGQISGAERASLAAFPTKSPLAYDHFLRGNYYMSQRTTGLEKAFVQFDSAFHLDSTFTRAGARLAYLFALALNWGALTRIPRDTLLYRGLLLASNMIRRDPNNSDAWMARGYLLKFRNPRTYQGVRESFERAVQLDRDNAEAWHQYGSILYELGQDSASTAAFNTALAIEPDREMTLIEASYLPTITGALEEAHRLLDSAVVVAPASFNARFNRANLLLLVGDTAGARLDVETALNVTGPILKGDRDLMIARIAALSGDTVAMNSLRPLVLSFADSAPLGNPSGFAPFILPALLAYGQRETALRILEAWRPRGPSLWFWLRWPTFDPLRQEPRFIHVVEESRPR